MSKPTPPTAGTLSNDFHGTEARVRNVAVALAALDAYPADRTSAQKAMARRLRSTLCGATGCTCGVVRGPQVRS